MLIAPCGMNCGICLAFQREKNSCPGCRFEGRGKPAGCKNCVIINCPHLAKTTSKFCYDCSQYPCARLKQLDKRYRKNYGMSMLENLEYIKEEGIDEFVIFETQRRRCENCGGDICIHRSKCLRCN